MHLTIDGHRLTESERLTYHADIEHGQRPRIRATGIEGYPFALHTPSGEPIRAYRTYKSAALALRLIESEVEA